MKTGGPRVSNPKKPKRKVEEANTLTSPPSIHTWADSITTSTPFDTLHLPREEYGSMQEAAVKKSTEDMIIAREEVWKAVVREAATFGKSTIGTGFRPKEKTCVIPEELLRELLDHVKALEKEVEAIKHPVYYTADVSDKPQMPLFSDMALEKLFGKGKI
jgi:hypothetical protein